MARAYRRRVQTLNYAAGQSDSVELRVSGLVRRFLLVLSGTIKCDPASTAWSGSATLKWNGGHVYNFIRSLTLRLEQKLILKQGSLRDFALRQSLFRKVPLLGFEAGQGLGSHGGGEGGFYEDFAANGSLLPSPQSGTTDSESHFTVVVPLNFIRPLCSTPLDTQLDMTQFNRLDLDFTWGEISDVVTATGSNRTFSVENLQLDIISEISTSDVAPSAFYVETAANMPTQQFAATASADKVGLEYELVTAPNLYISSLILQAYYASGGDHADVELNPGLITNIALQETIGGQVDNPYFMPSGADALLAYDEYFSLSSRPYVPYVANIKGCSTNVYDTGRQWDPLPGQDLADALCPAPIMFGPSFEGRPGYDLQTGQANDLRLLYGLENPIEATITNADVYVRLLEQRVNYTYDIV